MNNEYLREIAAGYLTLMGGRLQPWASVDLALVYALAMDRLDTASYAVEHPGEFPDLEARFGLIQANAIGFASALEDA